MTKNPSQKTTRYRLSPTVWLVLCVSATVFYASLIAGKGLSSFFLPTSGFVLGALCSRLLSLSQKKSTCEPCEKCKELQQDYEHLKGKHIAFWKWFAKENFLPIAIPPHSEKLLVQGIMVDPTISIPVCVNVIYRKGGFFKMNGEAALITHWKPWA